MLLLDDEVEVVVDLDLVLGLWSILYKEVLVTLNCNLLVTFFPSL
jgi:hypothetical protein